MTIIVGLICKQPGSEAVILASDSQTSYGEAKRLDTQKIHIARFKNGSVLVAEAGTADLSGRVITNFQEKAKEMTLDNYRTAADLLQNCVRETRRHLREINEGCITTDDGWKRFFREDAYFQLMLAYMYDEKPHLWTIDIDFAYAKQVQSHCEAIGIGRTVAHYLIGEITDSQMAWSNALVTAIYIVEKTKEKVEGCGGPARAAYVHLQKKTPAYQRVYEKQGKPFPHGIAEVLTGKEIGRITKRIGDLDADSREARNKKLKQMIDSIQKEFEDEINRTGD